MKSYILILLIATSISCSSDQETTIQTEMYFPSIGISDWENTTPESLDWKISELDNLYNFLSQNGTRAFIVLKDGKIVIEKYWGNTILNTAQFDQNSDWYWASAGKTLTSILVGIAQQEGLLNINDKTSDYLGNQWTDMELDKENLIFIKHQLTMTTGLDYTVANPDCTESSCLRYKKDAGTQWYYHNAPYTLLKDVVSAAAKMSYDEFTNQKLASKIGMNGSWIQIGNNNVYWSTARDAARFGLLLLNEGKWNETSILTDSNYFNAMTNSSQDINPSYGYLTWLNGKSSIILPSASTSFNMSLSQDAPNDLYAAMGKNGQYIDVVPSENLVIIRIGEAPDNSVVPTSFHNEMWEKINAVKN